MIVDYNPYVIEQKLGNDFLRESAFICKKEKQIVENQHYVLIAENYTKPKKTISKDISYNLNNILNLKIPFELQFLKNVYNKSEYIILLENDWDDNGSPKYNIETWKKALIFLNDYSSMLLNDFNKKIEQPKIYHGPKGSIDILIENSSYSLLINVLDNIDKAIYFGKDNFGNISKGEINIKNTNNALIPIAFNL